jgi:L-ribulokinase
MQIYADVCARPIRVAATEEGPARGSAIYAAVAAGLYSDVKAASKALAVKDWIEYAPIRENVEAYDLLYREYSRLYDYFSRENSVMKRVREI